MKLTKFETKNMIYTLGETLLDIIFKSDGSLSATPGGAMLNVAVSLARRKTPVTLISELGDDLTGNRIIGFLLDEGISSKCITRYQSGKTSLALAFLDKDAKPSYNFYKTYPERRKLITDMRFTNNDYLLFGSVYSLDPDIRKDVVAIINKAKQNGTTIIYDPNIRHAYHLDNTLFRQAVQENIATAHIIKGSDEDFTNLFGPGNPDTWAELIRKTNKNATVIVTLGQNGCAGYVNNRIIKIPAKKIKAVSTVGAGDAFNAGMLYTMNRTGEKPDILSDNQWNSILETATDFAAEVCSREENYVGKI